MKVFVIDNSVVSGSLLQNQATAYSDAVATLLYTRLAFARSCGITPAAMT